MALHLKIIAILGIVALLLACNAEPDGNSDNNLLQAHKVSPAAEYWLDSVGRGNEQTNNVCERGDDNAVTRALCRDDLDLSGLKDLYEVLGIQTSDADTSEPGQVERSALKPHAFFTQGNLSNVTEFSFPSYQENLAIVAFSQGDQLIELVAYDAQARQLTFYLLAYEQSCGATTCGDSQLQQQESESNWASWTLYDDSDLVDTPLDCLSCHDDGGDVLDSVRSEYAPNQGQQKNADLPVFDLPVGLTSAEVELASAYTDNSLSVEQLLQQSCVRCHDDRAPEGAYARFRVDQLGSLTPELAEEAVRRINLPRYSSELMPPESAATLSDSAKAKLADYLMQRAQQNQIQEYSF